MDYEQVESSQKQWHNDLQHQEIMNSLVEQSEHTLFATIKPKLYKDGNMWCCLLGENLMEGVCGFGESPYQSHTNHEKQNAGEPQPND